MRRLLPSAIAIMVMAAFADTVRGEESVRIVFDTSCMTCSTNPTGPFDLWIVLQPDADGCVGCMLSEVNFSVSGLPPGWAVQATANPAASFASDPFDPYGATIQFPLSPDPMPVCTVLYTCHVTPSATPGSVLEVKEHLTKNCAGPPGIVLGPTTIYSNGGPLFSINCLKSTTAQLDGAWCSPMTAIEASPWTRVKQMYR